MRGQQRRARTQLVWLGTAGMVVVVSAGCDLSRSFVVPRTVSIMRRAAPAAREHWDWEMLGHALPASLVQSEGLLRITPDNEQLLEGLIQATIIYGYGWVQDAAEEAELQGDLEEAERQRARARWYYQRAFDLGKYWIRLHAEGWDEALAKGEDAFRAWLRDNFTEPDQAPMLLWTGYAWAAIINVSRDDMEAIADLPFAVAVVERSVELDPDYQHGAGLSILATVEASKLTGDLDKAARLFEEALRRSRRGVFLVHYQYARTVAVRRQDKRLFWRLIREALLGGRGLPDSGLVNAVARRRLLRLARQADELFVQ